MGQVALDQIRTVDLELLIHKLGLVPKVAREVSRMLLEIFAR
jgi:hypothetical protein